MPTGDVMKATLEGTFDSEPVVVGLGFVSNSGAATFADDAAQLFDELYTVLDLGSTPGGFMGPLSEHYRLDNIRVQDLNPGLSAGLVFPAGPSGANTTDDALPPNDALCVTWRTGLKGKENRGRSYLTGFAEDSQTNGYWIPEIQTWANDAFAAPLLAAFGPTGTGGYTLSLVHTQSAGAPIIPPTASPIISYTVRNQVRSLRRRAVGVRISRRPSAP